MRGPVWGDLEFGPINVSIEYTESSSSFNILDLHNNLNIPPNLLLSPLNLLSMPPVTTAPFRGALILCLIFQVRNPI